MKTQIKINLYEGKGINSAKFKKELIKNEIIISRSKISESHYLKVSDEYNDIRVSLHTNPGKFTGPEHEKGSRKPDIEADLSKQKIDKDDAKKIVNLLNEDFNQKIELIFISTKSKTKHANHEFVKNLNFAIAGLKKRLQKFVNKKRIAEIKFEISFFEHMKDALLNQKTDSAKKDVLNQKLSLSNETELIKRFIGDCRTDVRNAIKNRLLQKGNGK